MKRLGKELGIDRRGGIEGLPLQLLIVVMVAGVGSAVILGWMGELEAPSTIGTVHSSEAEIVLVDDDGDGISSVQELSMIITVLDQDGDPISGATVVLEGCGIVTEDGSMPHATTNEKGEASFEGLEASRPGGSVGFVSITVAKTGMSSTKSISVPVVCL